MNENRNPTFNTEWLNKNKSKLYIVLGVLLVILIIVIFALSPTPRHRTIKNHHEKIDFVPMNDVSTFGESESQTELGTLSVEQSEAKQNLDKLNQKDQATQQQIQALHNMILDLNNKLDQAKQAATVAEQPKLPVNISDFSFQHAGNGAEKNTDPCPISTCVLPGSFVRAVLIGAADADASVEGQSATTPILFQVLESGTMPNGYHSHLKGCFVVGTVYGDISSERGEVKLQTISCIKDGISIVRNLNGNGLVYDDSGRGGIKGIPFMNNAKLLFDAGLSGLASGVGSALAQSQTTQSVSPLGSTTTVSPGNIAEYGAASGASTALGMLAQYYIKRANQYHPVIQLNPGAIVDLMFLQQFNIAPDLPKSEESNSPRYSNSLSNFSSQNSSGFNVNNLNLGKNVSSAQAELIRSQIKQAMLNQQAHS